MTSHEDLSRDIFGIRININGIKMSAIQRFWDFVTFIKLLLGFYFDLQKLQVTVLFVLNVIYNNM